MRREHAARLDDPVDVVGRRLRAHEDDGFPRPPLLLRPVGVEHDLAGRGARRGVQPAPRDLVLRVGSIIGWSSWSSWPGSTRTTASSCPSSPSETMSTAMRSAAGGRPLPRARLEDVEGALLDRELDVLHLAVVLLEPRHRRGELLVGGREPLRHGRDRLGRADAGDDVLALRVDEELAPQTRARRSTGRG